MASVEEEKALVEKESTGPKVAEAVAVPEADHAMAAEEEVEETEPARTLGSTNESIWM